MKYGFLEVIKEGQRYKLCKCICGKIIKVRTLYLKKGSYKSCGCKKGSHWKKISNEEKLKKMIKNTDEINGCLLWKGAKNIGGYGQVGFRGKTTVTHRLVWEIIKGKIPEKMKICHKCDNRNCINIDHLFLGTQKDNMDDMRSKNRENFVKGIDHPNSKLNLKLAKIICSLTDSGYNQTQIGKMLNLHQATISAFLMKKTKFYQALHEAI